jgi:Carboxypeptidase regulatory-like domain
MNRKTLISSFTAAAFCLLLTPALAAAGTIEGKVTDASTSEPIEGIKVCGFIIGTDVLSCDRTDAAGFYDVLGLPTNSSYKVEFSAAGTELGYPTEYYNNKFSLFKAISVAVTAGAVTSGIDAQLAP